MEVVWWDNFKLEQRGRRSASTKRVACVLNTQCSARGARGGYSKYDKDEDEEGGKDDENDDSATVCMPLNHVFARWVRDTFQRRLFHAL